MAGVRRTEESSDSIRCGHAREGHFASDSEIVDLPVSPKRFISVTGKRAHLDAYTYFAQD